MSLRTADYDYPLPDELIARLEPKFDTYPARLLVGFLAFMQPLGRGWARYFTWLKAQPRNASALFWWIVKLRTVTEYHGGPKCLTRVRLTYKMVVTTFLANVLFLSAIIYRHTVAHDRHFWLIALYAIFLIVLFVRARRLKRRTADLVMAAAAHCQLTRVYGDKARPRPALLTEYK